MNICWMCKKVITNNYDINKTSQGLVICNTCFPEWKKMQLVKWSHRKKKEKRSRRNYHDNKRRV